jgi:hypothetical protein
MKGHESLIDVNLDLDPLSRLIILHFCFSHFMHLSHLEHFSMNARNPTRVVFLKKTQIDLFPCLIDLTSWL